MTWSPAGPGPVTLRTMANCSSIRASRGKYSQKWAPGTLVGTVPNGPPVGAPGLGSKVSNWLGAPLIRTKMTRLAGLRTREGEVGGCATAAPAAAAAPSPAAAAPLTNCLREIQSRSRARSARFSLGLIEVTPRPSTGDWESERRTMGSPTALWTTRTTARSGPDLFDGSGKLGGESTRFPALTLYRTVGPPFRLTTGKRASGTKE